MEMLPRQLVQQPCVVDVMLLDQIGYQQMMSDDDVLKQMLTVACTNKCDMYQLDHLLLQKYIIF